MELKTIPQIVKKCREIDPDTAINESMLYALSERGELPFDYHGNRKVYDFGTVIGELTRLLFLPGLRTFPKIRTVAQGAKELHDAGTGLNERHIRAFIRSDTLRTIEIGNRRYIALQSFESPYSSRLFGCIREKKTDGLRYRNTADDQIERIRAEHAKPPLIRRVR